METLTRKIAAALRLALGFVLAWTHVGQRTRTRRIGRYALGPMIGRGGMGEVYRSRSPRSAEEVAVKVLSADHDDGEGRRRFAREARIASALCSPNIAKVHEQGTTWDGRSYYVMELVEGDDLEKVVEREGALEPARVVAILKQVCAALVEVHAQGFVHRDLKPSNVGLARDGVVKLFDFGLATELAAARDATKLVSGTPGYLAPEAIVAPETLDARADLYALGGVAYWLLTGTQVFEGTSIVEVCSQHLHDTPERPSARLGQRLPSKLEDLVLRLLAKDPASRPASAKEVLDVLETVPRLRLVPGSPTMAVACEPDSPLPLSWPSRFPLAS